jgi:hypothetical protein
MPTVTGKTGADAIWRDVDAACRTYRKYAAKFDAVVNQALSAEAISADQATIILSYVHGINALCTALNLLAEFSGLSS